MTSRHFVKTSTLALALFAAVATASAAAISTFDTDAENWSIVSFTNPNAGDFSVLGTTAPTFNATGGNPGGFISTADPDSGDFMFGAPSKFLGNQTGAGVLSYDLTYLAGNLDYKPVDVMLTGGATRLLWISNPTLAPGAGFAHVAIGLAPTANWHLGTVGGATPTATDFQNVLTNVSGLFLSGEYTVGLFETAGLDNVQLSVPEPATGTIVIPAILAAFTIALRRRATA